MIWNSILNPDITNAIEKIEKEILTWEGITCTAHKFGGLQFNYGDKEIGHVHSNGILDILFNKKIKRALLEEGKSVDHHIFSHSGWISFYIRSESDVEKAISLLELSYRIKSAVAD